jgi:hypothetical protein
LAAERQRFAGRQFQAQRACAHARGGFQKKLKRTG